MPWCSTVMPPSAPRPTSSLLRPGSRPSPHHPTTTASDPSSPSPTTLATSVADSDPGRRRRQRSRAGPVARRMECSDEDRGRSADRDRRCLQAARRSARPARWGVSARGAPSGRSLVRPLLGDGRVRQGSSRRRHAADGAHQGSSQARQAGGRARQGSTRGRQVAERVRQGSSQARQAGGHARQGSTRGRPVAERLRQGSSRARQVAERARHGSNRGRQAGDRARQRSNRPRQKVASGRTCSISSHVPPGLRTRTTSSAARRGSSMEQKTRVETTVSKDASAKRFDPDRGVRLATYAGCSGGVAP